MTLKREPASGATEARHHLVQNQQDAVAVAEGPHPRQVPRRWNEDAGGTGDRLQQYGRDRGGSLTLDHALEVAQRTFAFLFGSRRPELAAVKVGAEEVHVAAREFVWDSAPVAGRHDRCTGVAMVRAISGENLVATGVQPRHPDRVLDRIRTTVGEEDLIERVWRTVDDAFRSLASGEVSRRRCYRRQRPDLLDDRLRDGRMLVADIDVHQLAREIQIGAARVVPHPRTQPAGDHKRLEGTLRGPGVEHECSVEVDRALVELHRCGVFHSTFFHDHQVAFCSEEGRRSASETMVPVG